MDESTLGDSGEVTRLLGEIGRGQKQAVNDLLPLVYDELHRLARSYFRRERGEHLVLDRWDVAHQRPNPDAESTRTRPRPSRP